MTLGTLFEASFRERRDQVGLEWKGTSFTFGELDARANRMARALAARSLGSGDRLAVYLANRLEVIDLYLACTRLGITYVPINVLYREREIEHILRDVRPVALLSDGMPPATVQVPLWQIDELAREAAAMAPDPLVTPLPDEEAAAAIIYTSGTTGAAKGAVLTQANFAANALRLDEAWRITASDRLLLALPLFHVHGLGNGLHCWLAAGARMRLLERFDASTTPAELLDFETTVFFGVPTMYVRLLEVAEPIADRIGKRMRLFVSGSAPLPTHVFNDFQRRYRHAILERYGMTETLMILGNPYDKQRRAGTVGPPLPGVEVRLLDGDRQEVPDGQGGELYVRSDALFAGYFGQPDATREAFVDGWFRTGDLAVRSNDGYYTLRGRRSDVIISGGFNVYPREIEELLIEQDGVADAAVAGIPDRVRGEVPIAYIVGKPDRVALDVARLEAVCRQKLASFKVPRSFVQVEGLPRTALGKVQKHLLPTDSPIDRTP
jgi:malonyl-CoA/methylmalonyl-CoA synthetase